MLKHQIINLIQEKREGSYWDFKAEYHKDKAELLHDIICLSNGLPNQEAYVILGVADNGHILGITGDSNRKTQEELISFITGKKFAAGRHPKISLMTLEYDEKKVDVIIITTKGHV